MFRTSLTLLDGENQNNLLFGIKYETVQGIATERSNLLSIGSEDREVLGVGRISVAILPS